MSVTFYYADWCPHCKNTKPAWKKAKAGMKGVTMREVEDQQMSADEKAKISGFPTFVVTKNGQESQITGERTDGTALLKELKSKLGGGGSRRRRTHRRQRKLRHRTLRNYKALA